VRRADPKKTVGKTKSLRLTALEPESQGQPEPQAPPELASQRHLWSEPELELVFPPQTSQARS
jgi:hypothetical protein